MKLHVITPFPDMVNPWLGESIMRKAREKEVATFEVWNLRDFTDDKHKTVDDYPYGGGAGMILKPEPLFRAVDAIREKYPGIPMRILFPTPQGRLFSQEEARSLSYEEQLVFICGHYRGVDERVVESMVTDEISIGDYILTGGELAAAVIIDAVVRLLPGVLGDFDSAEGDSFNNGLLDYPHYTRPVEFRGKQVPDVLLSGHHANVGAWRKEQALKRTKERRPDLLEDKK